MKEHFSHKRNRFPCFLGAGQTWLERRYAHIPGDFSAAGRKEERASSGKIRADWMLDVGRLSFRTVPFIPATGKASASFLRPFLPTQRRRTGSTVGENFPLAAHFRGPQTMLRHLFKSATASASSPQPEPWFTSSKAPCQTSLDPSKIKTFARHFPGQRRDRIALSLGESAGGPLALFFRLPFPRQARSGTVRVSARNAFAQRNNSR